MKITGKTLAIIAGAVVLALVVGVIGVFAYVNSVRNQGIEKEAALVAQYQDNQNELSAYISTFNETLGISDRNATAVNAILVEAVKGRYDGNMQPGTDGSLFSAISEAYPDLTATTESYAKVQDLVISGRAAYKNKQSLLLDRIRDYQTWQNKGLIRSSVVNMLGFPSERLEVTVGQQSFTGQAALDQIKTLVLTSSAVDAYSTGTMNPLLSPTAPPTTIPSAPASATPATS